MKILIVTGGNTSERRISLLSAKQVKEGLKQAGFSAKLFDLKNGYEELKKLAKNFDVVFPVLHGEEGEGGELQKFLYGLKKPYVGGDYKGLKVGWYKIPFKKFCNENKILTSDWKIVKDKEDIKKFSFPSVLKASSGGSSKEVIILQSDKDLNQGALKRLLQTKAPLLIERFLPGIEVTVAILQNKPLPVLEIVPPKGGWFDYKNKYSGQTREIPFAPSVDKKMQRKVQKIALKIHKALRLGQISRTDFIIYQGKPYALEVNTIPGLTSGSLLPKAAKAAGISFPKLLEKCVNLAYESKISKV